MAGEVAFRRNFAEYGNEIRTFERSNDVGYVITELLFFGGHPYYPAGSLMGAVLSSVWLGEGEAEEEVNLDLILRCDPPSSEAPNNYYFFELIMRGGDTPYYGGYCDGSSIKLTDEFKNGHRVIETEFEGEIWRWVYTPGVGNGPGQYRFEEILGSPTTSSVRRRCKKTHRSP